MISFILNLPFTAMGLFLGLISIPTQISFHSGKPYAIILEVQSLWWTISFMRNTRAFVVGHTAVMGPKTEPKDLEHELIHVQQYTDAPLIYPILYYYEMFRAGGYKNNKYEVEAYRLAGNIYCGK